MTNGNVHSLEEIDGGKRDLRAEGTQFPEKENMRWERGLILSRRSFPCNRKGVVDHGRWGKTGKGRLYLYTDSEQGRSKTRDFKGVVNILNSHWGESIQGRVSED